MPIPTLQVWDGLVSLGKALGGFKDVRRYPLHKVQKAEFFRDIPDLKLPALIYIFKGRGDRGNSAPVKREGRWSAVIVVEDAKGGAEAKAAELLDLHDGIFGRHICEDQVWIMAGNEVQFADTEPRFCVAEVAFRTMEGIETLRSAHG